MRVMRLLSSLHHDDDERGVIAISRQLVRQGYTSLVVSSTPASHELAQRLCRDGSEYKSLYLAKQSWWSLWSAFGLARLIHQFRPDVIHVHSRTPAWVLKWALELVPVALRPLTVGTIYGYYPSNAYNRAIFDCDHLIAVSDSVKVYILQYHDRDPDSVTRVYRGVDTQRYLYRHTPSVHWLQQIFAEYPKLEHQKWLLFPSKIDHHKGQQWLFDIVGNLRAQFPKIHVIIMDDADADNNFVEEFVQRANALDLMDYFTFIGRRDDGREWLSAANIVLGLANQPESIGINVLKAIHLGTPVVAWARGVYSEILTELYPEGLVYDINAITLCEVIAEQLTHKDRPAMPQNFSQKQSAREIVAVYEHMLKNLPSPAAKVSQAQNEARLP
ncbi:glycosyltransferase [Moraxella atlantae]|uniref:glycosyltransferase n=1 Tax=Faucicola atlantae TaxID=34059 RepID=UPI003751B593